ncbi:MAG: hypothetical protein RIQ94_1504 [Pseudomonadota bacterium]|jgi:voltage-gated potassium channel Kch
MNNLSNYKKPSLLHEVLEWLSDHIVAFLCGLATVLSLFAIFQNIEYQENDSIVMSLVRGIYVLFCTTLSLDEGDALFNNLAAASIKVIVAASILKVYLKQVGFTFDSQWAKFSKKHIIVCGSGEIAVTAAMVLASATKVVLIADKTIDDANVSQLRKKGVVIIISQGDDNRNLRTCQVNKAEILLAFHADYSDNIMLCKLALKLVNNGNQLRCLCNVPDINLKNTLSTSDFFSPEDVVNVTLINPIELAARKMLEDYPPDIALATNENVQLKIVLIGLGSIGQSLLFYLGQLGHYRGGHQPLITVIDHNSHQQYQQLINRIPALSHLLEMTPMDANINDLSEMQSDELFGHSFNPSVVYVCTKNEICNVTAAKKIDRARSKAGLSYNIVVVDPPGGNLIQEFNQHNKRIQVVPLFSNKSSAIDVGINRDALRLFESAKDQMAQIIHQDYLDKNPTATINEDWQYLDESIRDSNRYAAAHIDIKLRAIGRKQLSFNADAETFVFSEQELDSLQRLEHARWCAQKRLAGWQYADVRDDKKLLHPCLVNFDDLPEHEKLKDRQSIQNIPHLLKMVNLMIAADTNV